MKSQSKNSGHLLYLVYANETGKKIPYKDFLSFLGAWFMYKHHVDTKEGVQTVVRFLDKKLVYDNK